MACSGQAASQSKQRVHRPSSIDGTQPPSPRTVMATAADGQATTHCAQAVQTDTSIQGAGPLVPTARTEAPVTGRGIDMT